MHPGYAEHQTVWMSKIIVRMEVTQENHYSLDYWNELILRNNITQPKKSF